jgi:hypothetical protein
LVLTVPPIACKEKRWKKGDRLDSRTVEGQRRAEQIIEQRRRFAEAREAEELDAELERQIHWPVLAIASIVEYMLWPFNALARLPK